MRRVRLYTLAEDEKLLALRLVHNGRGNGGLPTIARKMGRAVSSVRYRLMTLADYEEGYKVRRRRGWSDSDYAQLLEWRAQGVKMRICGKRLGRSLESIKARLALPNRRKRYVKKDCADLVDV